MTSKANMDDTVLFLSPDNAAGGIRDLSKYKHTVSFDGSVTAGTTEHSGAAGMVFDGNGDIISVSDLNGNLDFGTNDFTIEAWCLKYANGTNSYDPILASWSGGSSTQWLFEYSAQRGILFSLVGTGYAHNNTTSNINDGLWHHVAVTRKDGVIRLWKDGVEQAKNASDTLSSQAINTTTMRVGYYSDGTAYSYKGHITNLRVTNGTARYTGTFTPPNRDQMLNDGIPDMTLDTFNPGATLTFAGPSGSKATNTHEPPTPASGEYVLYHDTPDDQHTVLLMHMDGENNGTVFRDSAFGRAQGISHLITPTNAKTSTTHLKFGKSSAYFDGTGDYLTVGSSSDFAFGTGDFTIETWVRYDSASTFPYLLDGRTSGTNGDFPSIYLRSDDSYKPVYYVDGDQRIRSSAGMSISTWYHLAIVRSGGTTTMYLDGASVGSFSDSFDYQTCPLRIGDYSNGSYGLNGYIDEFRICKGVARYTTNFTPPELPYGGGLRMKDPNGIIYTLSLSGSA